ncbi:MAG: hypothetical protein LBR28_03320 [Bacteroidales bacterium]|nr:hypothetical protein [Bacteroidales bacterium]
MNVKNLKNTIVNRYFNIMLLPVMILISVIFFTSCDKKKNAQREANKFYQKKDYSNAEANYRKVLTMDSVYSNTLFNLGNTHYRMNDTNKDDIANSYWQKSYDSFEEKDSLQKMWAIYNQGNVKFRKATQHLDSLSSADLTDEAREKMIFSSINYEQLREAANDYKAVLRKFSDDTAARYNLSLINYLLSKQPKDKNQKQNQQQQQQNQQNQQQNQQNQKQNQQQQQQNQQNQQQNQQQPSSQQRQKKDKEEVNRMLEALKNNEKNTLLKIKKNEKQKAEQYKSEKDW